MGQLNSQFGKAVNELRVTYTAIRDIAAEPIGDPAVPAGHGAG